ncbi:MAG: DUF2470 domain-containing protein [Myxococcota bacterium]
MCSKTVAMSDNHGRTTPETPLTEGVVQPSHGERARTLVAGEGTGTLSTLSKRGYPHGSFVTFALAGGHPCFCISKLAAHTQNLLGDGRASLLVHEPLGADPLAAGRVTLIGSCAVDKDPAVREAFLAKHPGAAYYADFSDFAFWRLHVEEIRYIGGYGRMSWVEAADFVSAEADPLAPAAAGIIEHMNDDHLDANVAYARAFTRATDAEEAYLASVDRYGFELSVRTERGLRPARVAWAREVTSGEDARKAFIERLQVARKELGDAAKPWAIVKRRKDGAKELGVDWLAKHFGEHRLIDVREANELVGPLGALEAEHVPMAEVPEASKVWDKDAPLLIICRSGNRSATAAKDLEAAGFKRAVSIRGGMKAWRAREAKSQ